MFHARPSAVHVSGVRTASESERTKGSVRRAWLGNGVVAGLGWDALFYQMMATATGEGAKWLVLDRGPCPVVFPDSPDSSLV